MDGKTFLYMRQKYKLGIIVLFILILSFVSVFMSEKHAHDYSYLIDIAAFLCLVLSLKIVRVHRETEFRWIGRLAAWWLGLNLVAELVWVYLEDVLGIDPFPSIADVIWLASYIPLFFLIFKIIRLYRKDITPTSVRWVGVLSLPVFSSIVYLGVLIFRGSEDMLAAAVSLSYPLLGISAFLLLVLILAAYRKALLEVYWWIITLGILFNVLGDYHFAYFEALNMYYTGSLPDSFYLLSYLVILLGFGMILRTKRVYFSIAPVHEDAVDTSQAYRLERGLSYVIEDPRTAFDVLKDLTTHGVDGLSISRLHPSKVKTELGLERIPLLWLSKVDEHDMSVDPVNLEKMAYLMEKFMRKSGDSVILLSGIEYLIIHNGFDRVFRFLHDMNERTKRRMSRFIISVDRNALSKEQWSSLVREFSVMERKIGQ